MTGTLAVRRPSDTASMEIAPGIPSIYPGLDARLGHLARNQILSHLAKLENEGRVSASGERFTCLHRS